MLKFLNKNLNIGKKKAQIVKNKLTFTPKQTGLL